MAWVNKVDEIVIKDLNTFDSVLKIILRDDGAMELYYIDDDGGEPYAGNLDNHTAGDVAKIRRLVVGIKQVIKEKPFSRRSLNWLAALARAGLLEIWEPHLS
jgi:hypothetical protein